MLATTERIDVLGGKTCPNSDPCGDTCIAKGLRCNIELGPEMEERVARVRKRLADLPKLNPASGFRQTLGKIVNGISQPGLTVKQRGIETAIAIGAIGLAAHAKARKRLETGLDNSADTAELDSKGRTIPDMTGMNQVTFAIDGMAYGTGAKPPGTIISGALAEQPEFDDHQIVSVTSADRTASIPGYEEMGGAEKLVARSIDQSRKFIKNTLVRGGDPLAQDMASQIMAYNEQAPGKQINVVAYGSGGHISAEALAIVAKKNPQLADRVRSVNMQTPDLKLVDERKNVRSIAGRGHPLSITPMAGKKVVIDGRDDGTGDSFVRSSGVMRQIKGAIQTRGAIGGSPATTTTQGTPGFGNYGSSRPSSDFNQQPVKTSQIPPSSGSAPASKPGRKIIRGNSAPPGTVESLGNTPKAKDNAPAPTFNQSRSASISSSTGSTPASKPPPKITSFTEDMKAASSLVNQSVIFDKADLDERFPGMDGQTKDAAFALGKLPLPLFEAFKHKAITVDANLLIEVGSEIRDSTEQSKFGSALFKKIAKRGLNNIGEVSDDLMREVFNDYKSQRNAKKDSEEFRLMITPSELKRVLATGDMESILVGLRIPGGFFNCPKKEKRAKVRTLRDSIMGIIKNSRRKGEDYDFMSMVYLDEFVRGLGGDTSDMPLVHV